jgi:flagellar basal-body rod protein FlgB
MQLASASADGPNRTVSQVHNAYEIKPDGNAISTEAEMKKAADTAADYQLASNVYKKSVSLIELALGSNKG